MAKLETLQKIQERMRKQIMVEKLAGQSNGNSQPLYNAMAVVPEAKIWGLVQWMHEVILPKVLQHRGAESAEYKNYEGIRDALIWAMYICNASEQQQLKIGNDKMLIEFLQQRCALLDRELTRYTTAEQLLATDSVQLYQKSIVARAIDMLETKPKTPENIDPAA